MREFTLNFECFESVSLWNVMNNTNQMSHGQRKKREFKSHSFVRKKKKQLKPVEQKKNLCI